MASADEDYGPPRQELSGLDKFYTSNFVLAIILSVCCNGIALILGIVGLITCKDPKAKQNALICTIIAAVITALGLVVQFGGFLGNR
jgi:hypothetical protein